MITAGSIKVYSRFSISSLLDMEMETKEGCHSRLALRGLLSEGKNGTELSQDAVVVKGTDEEGREETLFCGTIQETHIFHENGVGQVILTAASGSVRMDKRKRSRSFQDTSLPCAEVMRGIVSEYGGTLDCEDPTMKIGTPMVQYEETDWEFCRRLAGR
ncbi:contractile injection system protein, VgrG/Pvc8 family, partial [uncultured Acetatifactor sp.]|uniref:contractile injection system protein, VgrG/Pvc8 family n=1 Tax=uncultured Acetatifactor sp. TaxID=1671927 RepID=UPI002619CC35